MNKIFLKVIIISVLATSCQKEVTLNQLPYDGILSIECLITPNKFPELYLNKTAPYLSGAALNSSFFARGANVSIKSVLNTITFKPDSIFNFFQCDYIYFYKGNSPILANTEYELNVLFESNNYVAVCNTNQAIVSIDSVSYVKAFKDLYGEHEGVVIYYNDPPAKDQYYRYEMNRWADSSAHRTNGGKSPCLNGMTVRVVEIGRTIYSDQNSNGQNSTITFEPAFKHKLGDTAYIQLQTMDKNSFDYYDQLDRQKLAQFNPFVEPSYLKPTQFKDAFGCFGAYSISDKILFVYPE